MISLCRGGEREEEEEGRGRTACRLAVRLNKGLAEDLRAEDDDLGDHSWCGLASGERREVGGR